MSVNNNYHHLPPTSPGYTPQNPSRGTPGFTQDYSTQHTGLHATFDPTLPELYEDFEDNKGGNGDGDDDGDSSRTEKGSVIDRLHIPAWAKFLLKKALDEQPDNSATSNLPSSADAAKTMSDFQKTNHIELLSLEQMQKMAETGELTLDNGKTLQVPPEVKLAAEKFMANDAKLFKKLEAASPDDSEALLSRADYKDALMNGSIGKPGTVDLPELHGLSSDSFYNFVMNGALSNNRPSEYDAAKTMHDFQTQNHIKLLSSDQMQQMADTGKLTLDNGKTIQVPSEAQAAAKKFTANNGALFKKLQSVLTVNPDGTLSRKDGKKPTKDVSHSETLLSPTTYDNDQDDEEPDYRGPSHYDQRYYDASNYYGTDNGNSDHDGLNHDGLDYDNDDGYQHYYDPGIGDFDPQVNPSGSGLPSALEAANTMQDFQAQNHIKKLNASQMQDIIDTGYCTLPNGWVVQATPEARNAARKFMENDSALFNQVAFASGGKKDGVLTLDNYKAAMENGSFSPQHTYRNVPSSDAAAKIIYGFQEENQIKELTSEQMRKMAETGTLTLSDGQTFDVPPAVSDAARRYMLNNGSLFNQVAPASGDKKDGVLTTGDYKAAVKKELISEPGGSSLPSLDAAAKIIYGFQEENQIKELTSEQMREMAETGTLTLSDGKAIDVPPAVWDAARRYMLNNGSLFNQVAPASGDKKDGVLTTDDYKEAVKKGLISEPGDGSLPSSDEAAKAIRDFLMGNQIKELTREQMLEMAETGTLTLSDGKTIDVSPEVLDAARRYMLNNGSLFNQIASAFDDKKDDVLTTGDYKAAVKKGLISEPETADQ